MQINHSENDSVSASQLLELHMQICDMRLKGTFGNMTDHTIMSDLSIQNNDFISIVRDNQGNKIKV